MSDRHNEDWLKSFVEFASYGEAPLKTLFWTGVSTIAGALRRRVWIDQKYFQWTPCFYVILVAPPGVISKSTTANIGINLLRDVPGVKFGPDVVTWQALVQALGESTEAVHEPATDLFHTMSALTICSDEFGTFLDPNDRGMVDALTSLWDGKQGTFTKVTKTSGNDAVENPWVNIIACTTPGWIAANFPESMVGGGFTSRCVLVYAERKRQLVAYPGLRAPADFHEKRASLVHDLEVISQMIGEYRLSTSAIEWGEAWYEKHWSSRPEDLDNERFGGYLARKQTHIHKLAMVLSASRSSNLIIEPETLAFAEGMVTALEKDMPRVFETIGQNDQTRGISELVQIILTQRELALETLYRKLRRIMDAKTFHDALNSAVLAGYIRLESRGNTTFAVALEPYPQSGD